jgi:hypothetical protein
MFPFENSSESAREIGDFRDIALPRRDGSFLARMARPVQSHGRFRSGYAYPCGGRCPYPRQERDVGVPRGPGGPPHLALIRDGRRSSAKTVPENEDPNGSRRV